MGDNDDHVLSIEKEVVSKNSSLLVVSERSVLCGFQNGSIQLWEIQSKSAEAKQTYLGHRASVQSMCKINDHHFASGCDNYTIRIWALSGSAECVHMIEFAHDIFSLIYAHRWGYLIVGGGGDGGGRIRVWSLNQQGNEGFSPTVQLEQLGGHLDSVLALAFLGSGHLISASVDHTLKIWDLESGENGSILTLRGHTDGCTRLAVFADGIRVLSASNDRTLRIWDTGSGECLSVFAGHSGYIQSVIIMPDNNTFVSAASDQTTRFWNAETGECTRSISTRSGYVTSLALLSDGRVVSAVSGLTMDGPHYVQITNIPL